MLILHETYDHWSVAVLTVTVHFSFVPTFHFFFFKYVAFCTGFNLLTLIFMLPYFIYNGLGFCQPKKTGEGPPPNLAISSQKTMKLGKGILCVEIFTN